MQLSKDKIFDWLILSQTYLQSALINVRTLSLFVSDYASDLDPNTPLNFCKKRVFGEIYEQPKEYLIFPILFNFKHGIELYLKVIIGIDKKDFPKNHNLLDLLYDSSIQDENFIEIVKRHAFCNFLLPQNIKVDTENQFERYPQGTPYDRMEEGLSLSQENLSVLISDIEYVFNYLRNHTKKQLTEEERMVV